MSDKIVSLLDYGISNIKSLSNALKKIDINHEIIQNLNNTINSKALIIPGVGSFPKAISILKEKKIFSQIQSYAKSEKPILGICLGMQMLFSKSYEFEETKGLDLIEGSVKKIPEEKPTGEISLGAGLGTSGGTIGGGIKKNLQGFLIF